MLPLGEAAKEPLPMEKVEDFADYLKTIDSQESTYFSGVEMFLQRKSTELPSYCIGALPPNRLANGEMIELPRCSTL